MHPFHSDDFGKNDVQPILELLATIDCAVIGPGLARTFAALAMLKSLVGKVPCPVVLDATALQPWTLKALLGKVVVLTPHKGELERMGIAEAEIGTVAKQYHLTILFKGPTDSIATPEGTVHTVNGGSPGLTVGGTGDALAGLTAGLIAQSMKSDEAALLASRVIKKAGEELEKEFGYAYGTKRLIERISGILKKM